MTMRGIALSLTVFLAFAGAAVASDYMLPVLLPPEVPTAPGEPPQEPQAQPFVTPPPNAGVAMGIALAGAALVVVGTFLVLGRRSPQNE